jgi:LysM repeat protein
METNDSNIKPQQTGGLKLMTVFIGVLVLHVLVIGVLSAYYMLKGGSGDDALADQTHKSAKSSDVATASDSTASEAGQADKNATASTSTAESSGGSINIPPPSASADQTASTDNNPPSTGASSTTIGSTALASAPVQRGPVITPVQPPGKTTVASTSAIAPATAPEAQPPVTINGLPYVVKPGDSLVRIAHQNHTSVAKLKAANNLTSDMLHIGQKMIIPARTQVATTATGADISGTTTILSDSPATPSMNVPASTTAAPTAGAVPHPAAPKMAAVAHGHTYTVVKGDTLTRIAHKFKTTPTAIMTANNLTDAAKLSIGKKLKIPTLESRSATNLTPEPAPTPQPPAPAPARAETTAQLANFVQ